MADAQEPAPETHRSDAEMQRLYALDRTVLANERTFAAWMRTGLAALVGGLAVERLLIDVHPAWLIRGVAVVLIVLSAGAFLLSAWRYAHLGIRLEALDVRIIPTRLTTTISVAMAVCSLLSLAALLLSGA
jgi:putative membrane protein